MQGAPAEWKACRRFGGSGEYGAVYCMAAVGKEQVAVGFERSTLCVYNITTGKMVTDPLECYKGAVTALAVAGPRMYSASRGEIFMSSWREGRVVAHSTQTWKLLTEGPEPTSYRRDRDSDQNVRSLLVFGPLLVMGSSGPRYSATARYEVVLMHAATLSPMVTLSQGPGENILSLLSTSGVLMAAAGRKLVVWRSMGGMEHAEFVSHRPRHYQQMALFGLEEISRLGVAQ